MIPAPFSSGVPPWLQTLQTLQTLQPAQSVVGPFWQAERVHDHLRNVRETVDLLKAVQKELEEIHLIKRASQHIVEGDDMFSRPLSDIDLSPSSNDSILSGVFQSSGNHRMLLQFSEAVKAKNVSLNVQESLSLEAANSLFSNLKNQLLPFSTITSQTSPWEERSVAVRLAHKLQKSKRNKSWKKRKRKRVAEMLCKERENYDKADEDADEWRAREIAKDIARRKVENMKAIAKLKANEERKRLESELELVLVVEKLQELRSIRIQKLKKQGHFLPEEDDKFLERVRAAVEEEERQAAAAADTDAARDAIASAEGTRKATHSTDTDAKDVNCNKSEAATSQDQLNEMKSESSGMDAFLESERQVDVQGSGVGYDSVTNLPSEYYHYYHGSNTDMGTLIEVRRFWDAYIRPGGSRIPGHWVQPPPPADEVWASYLVNPK